MRLLKRYTMIGILFVLVAGTLAHFLYDWTGRNPVAGLFAPVSESIWEHMKLVFFPSVLYSLCLYLCAWQGFLCLGYSGLFPEHAGGVPACLPAYAVLQAERLRPSPVGAGGRAPCLLYGVHLSSSGWGNLRCPRRTVIFLRPAKNGNILRLFTL